MDATPPVTPPRKRRFGPMKFSSVLLLVFAAGSGMAFVRSKMNVLSDEGVRWNAVSWRDEADCYNMLEVAQAFLTGVLLAFGIALLSERIRTRKAPRPWGIGRTTLAVGSFSLIGVWAASVFGGGGKLRAILHGTAAPVYNVDWLTPLYHLQDPLYSNFPIVLAAVWVSYRLSGRWPRQPVDLKEGMGRLLGLGIFASYIVWIFMPELCQGG